MKSSRVNRESRCPACLRRSDGATDPLGNAVPKPEDVAICAYCGSVNIYQTDLTLRTARQDEIDLMPEYLRRQLAVARVIQRHIAPRLLRKIL